VRREPSIAATRAASRSRPDAAYLAVARSLRPILALALQCATYRPRPHPPLFGCGGKR